VQGKRCRESGKGYFGHMTRALSPGLQKCNKLRVAVYH
jgi:hypothetical protein